VHRTCRASLGGEVDGYREVVIELGLATSTTRNIDDSEDPDEYEIGGQG